MKKKVLVLGASGLIAPNITAYLDPHYDLTLVDIKPHPHGRPVGQVDVTSYEQVFEAARGMDAIMNYTVNRPEEADRLFSAGVSAIFTDRLDLFDPRQH